MNETYLAYGVLIAVLIGVIWSFKSDAMYSDNSIVWIASALFSLFGILFAAGAFLLSVCWALSVIFP